jgi:hypothetical protein
MEQIQTAVYAWNILANFFKFDQVVSKVESFEKKNYDGLSDTLKH